MISIVTKDKNMENRMLALKFLNRDIRNTVLTGLRTLVADLHINSPSARAIKSVALSGSSSSSSSSSSASNPAPTTPAPSRRGSAIDVSSSSSLGAASAKNVNPMRRASHTSGVSAMEPLSRYLI